MSSDWTQRPYRGGDEQGMLDLLTAAFGRWPAVDIDVPPIDHLRWKLSSDESVAPYHCLRVVGEHVVGCELMVLQQYKVRDHLERAFLVTDMAVHPDYQGQGIMRDLWVNDRPEYIAAVDLLASISGNRTVNKHHKRLGRTLYLANDIDLLECSLPAEPAARRSLAISTVARFDDRSDDLWERASHAFSFAVVRSKDYMNWRYADPRAGRFTIRLAEDGEELLGYAVLRRSGGRAYIADLLTLPDRDDVLPALIMDALAHFGELGDGAVRCWMPRHHVHRQTLLRCGFRPIRRVDGFNVAPMGSRDTEFLATDERATVHLAIGDTDIV